MKRDKKQKQNNKMDVDTNIEINNSEISEDINKDKNSAPMYDKFLTESDSNKKFSNFYNFIQINAESIGIKSLNNEIIDFLNLELNKKIKEILNVSVS